MPLLENGLLSYASFRDEASKKPTNGGRELKRIIRRDCFGFSHSNSNFCIFYFTFFPTTDP